MRRVENMIQKRLTERAINLIVVLLGTVFVILGILFIGKSKSEISTILVSVGTSLIASAIVSYLSSIYIYNRRQGKELCELWGLESIIESRDRMNERVDEHLKEAKDTLDIIAYGLKSMRDSKDSMIRDRLAHGLKIRIITVDPSVEQLKQRDIDEGKIPGSTVDSIKQLCRWAYKLSKKKKGNVKIWFLKTLPTEVYFRVDDYIYVGPYQIGRESQRSITMEYYDNGKSNGKGFKYYQEYFEKVMEGAEEVDLTEYAKINE